MPQVYTRDLAITAVICFIGGVGFALLAVLVCHQTSHKKKLKESERRKEEEKESSTVGNHDVNHLGLDDNRRETLLRANRESTASDTRLESRGGQFQSRLDEDGYFRCPDCSNKGQRAMRQNLTTWNNRLNTEMEEDEEKEKRTMRMVAEEERRVPIHANFSSQARREIPETLPVYETDRDADSCRVNVESKSMGKDTLHCESCHRSYRATQQTIRPGRFKSGTRDSAIFNSVPPAQRRIEKSRNYNQFDMMNKTELRRESRNVTFDLEGLGILEQGNGDDEVRTPRDKEREKRAKILKVKLNLNPLRKSKVHPRKKNEQDHAVEKGSSRKSRDKRQRGKDRREKGGRGKSGDKMKGSPEKVKKSTKSRRFSDDGVEAREDDNKAEEKQDEPVQEQSANPDNAQSDDATAAAATDRAPISQGGIVQYQGTGLVLASPASQNHTNLPLLGSAGSQLTGSRFSLQGENVLLNSMAPGFKAMFPGGPASSAAPSISGPNLASSGAMDSFSRQTGLDLASPATSRLANTAHNPLQASSIQTAPLYNPQTALNLAAANPEPVQSHFQTRPPPDSASLPPTLTDPFEALGLLLIPEPQAPQIKESHAVQVQAAESLPEVSSQAPGAQTDAGAIAAGSAEGPPAAAAGDGVPAADASVSGDAAVLLHQEYVTEEGDSSPRRKLKLALPEKTSNRPPTALERKLR